MELMTLVRGSGAPPARLDHARFEQFFGLEFTELLGFGALMILMPLLTWGITIPEPAHLAMVLAFPLQAVLLFIVRHEDHSILYWLGRMIPFWFAQHTFRSERDRMRVTPDSEALDALVLDTEPQLSLEWRRGADGVWEMHVSETPLRPWRAWVAAGGLASGLEPRAWPPREATR